MFKRRSRKDDAAGPAGEQVPVDVATESSPGPWDVAAFAPDGVDRIDLGALLVPTIEGVELRLEADENGQIASVLVVDGVSGLQVGVFAAPRNEGIWDEVRAEIRDGIRSEGGDPQEADGPHGPELRAELDTPDGRQVVRFVGYDGPRWFVRGVFSGAAGSDVDAAPALDATLRGLVVVRGSDPMPVRDPLPLRLPRDVVEAQAEAAAQEERTPPTLPERGPEITETR